MSTHPHQHQQQQQIAAPPNTDPGARLLIVEKDVYSLRETVTALGTEVRAGFDKIDAGMKARSVTNWQPIGLCLGALMTVSGWGFGLFANFQARTDAAISEQKTISQAFVPRADINDKFSTYGQRRDDLQRLTDARIERIERDLDGVQKQVVPRGEHEQTWAGQRAKDDYLQRQIDQARKDLNDLNTPRDTIQGILKRLEDVERPLRAGSR